MTNKEDDNNNNPTVIIVGAGLAGLALALGLSTDFKVVLVEKQEDFTRTGSTFGLAPNGQKALEELTAGIVAELQKVGISMAMSGGIMLGWWNGRDALLERVRACDAITLHTGYLLQEIVDTEECVQATFQKRQGSEDVVLSLKGMILIGADGVNSSVRTNHLKLCPAKKTTVMMWRIRVQIDADDKSPAAELLRPYLDIPIVPMGIRLRSNVNYCAFNFHEKLPGTMTLSINYQGEDVDDIAPGTSPQKYMEAFAEDQEEIGEIRAIEELCDKEDGWHHTVRQKVVELPKEDGQGWGGRGRITLIGDAAHGMRPASGQGGSMAFEDAAVLCRLLRKLNTDNSQEGTIHNKQAIEETLAEFENSRLPRVRRMWDDQWERAEASYKNVRLKPWSQEFSQWVYQGV